MAFDGNGTFNRLYSWVADRNAGINIDATRSDNEDNGFATGLSTCMTKDGQSTPTANLKMGGFKFTNLGVGSARTDSISLGQAQDGAIWDAGTTSGTSTAYTATLSPAISAYADKQYFRVQFNAACGASPTINFNAVGAKKIYKNVAGTATQVGANEILANYIGILRYDTALDTAAGGFWLVNQIYYSTPTTTRGDLIYRGASADTRLAIGAANTLLATDGTDPVWRTLTAEIDAAIGSTQGQILYRDASSWAVLAPGTSGQFLKTQGAAANPTWANQKIAQMVNTTPGTSATGTTTIPLDNTIPQNTEGDQFMSLAITPQNASSTLVIDVVFFGCNSAATTEIVALFRDSTANALGAAAQFNGTSGGAVNIKFSIQVSASSTSSTTFKVRAGGSSAGTTTFNGQGGTALFGGVAASSITITEYLP